MLWISIGLVFGLACLGVAAMHRSRRSNREKASRLMQGERPLLRLDGITARIYVDRDLLGGPSSNGVNRAPANVVLTPRRLLVATHQGRLLELTQQTGGSVRNTGPNRLVIEGQRPGGGAIVRVELLTDQAETWAVQSAETLKTSRSAA